MSKKQTSNPDFVALVSQLEGYVGYPVPVNPENEQEYQQSRLQQTPVHSWVLTSSMIAPRQLLQQRLWSCFLELAV